MNIKQMVLNMAQNAMLDNIESLDKKTLQKELKKSLQEQFRLNNIIKPKEVNYNYLKLLFEKKDKEEVIKSFVYKCEQLERLYKSYNEKVIESMKKDNIIEELEKYIEENIKITKQALKFEGLDNFDKKKYSRDITLFEMILDKLKGLKTDNND